MAYELVVSRGMVIGVIITKVGCSLSSNFKFPLGASILHPVEAHANGLGPLLLQFFLENTLAVVLSTCIIVGGCGCTIYTRVAIPGNTPYAFINDAPISASASDAMIFVMILHTL